MNQDPRRLMEGFDESHSSDVVRSLLESGKDMSPPSGAQAQIWGRLEGLLGPAGAGGADPNPFADPPASPDGQSSALGSSPGSSAGSATVGSKLGLAIKLGLAGVGAGVVIALVTFMTRPAPRLSEDASAPMNGTSVADAAREGGPLAPDSLLGKSAAEGDRARGDQTSAVVVTQAPPAKEAESPAERAKMLMRESNGVRAARSLLASGDAAGALAELASLDKEVKKGMLGQERQVLLIEALAASGQGARAASLAKAFLDRHPSSPYAGRLAPFTQ